jgi:hypothetical protein
LGDTGIIPTHKQPDTAVWSSLRAGVVYCCWISPGAIATGSYFTQIGPGCAIIKRPFIHHIDIAVIIGIPSSAFCKSHQGVVVGFDNRRDAKRVINAFIAAIKKLHTCVNSGGFCCCGSAICLLSNLGSRLLLFMATQHQNQ